MAEAAVRISEWVVFEALADALSPARVGEVLAQYDQPWRVYHGRGHVLGLFGFARERGWLLSAAQALAVLFHDAVYVPGAERGRNEQASVDLLRLYAARAGLEPALAVEAAAVVLDTIEHQPTLPSSALVLDLDLSSLCAPRSALHDPSEDVWREYRPLLPADDAAAQRAFWAARCRVLQGFLDRARVFHSDEFAADPSLEAAARSHLQAELERGSAFC